MERIRGVGLGLRWPLLDAILETAPAELSWLEVAPENYMDRGGRFPDGLRRCTDAFPVVTHGLALNLGGFDELNVKYMKSLRGLARDLRTPWHSDHVCFSVVDGAVSHDLLPLPFNLPMANHVADRIKRAQDALGLPVAVENISAYARVPGSVMSEAEFLTEVLERADCGLLLDVNNVYVNSINHGDDARAMLTSLPLGRVWQIHIAGHEVRPNGRLVDTHAAPICEDVFELLGWVLARTGPKPVLLERDDNFPDWAELCAELRRVHAIVHHAEDDWNRPSPDERPLPPREIIEAGAW